MSRPTTYALVIVTSPLTGTKYPECSCGQPLGTATTEPEALAKWHNHLETAHTTGEAK